MIQYYLLIPDLIKIMPVCSSDFFYSKINKNMFSLFHSLIQDIRSLHLIVRSLGLSVSFKMEQSYSLFFFFYLSFITFLKNTGELFCVMTHSLGSSLGSAYLDQGMLLAGMILCLLSGQMSVWPVLVTLSSVAWLKWCLLGFFTVKLLIFPSVIF